MTILRTFIHEEWDVTGTLGLRPPWLAGTNATNGMGVAHDMLEHFHRHQGNQIETECEALGSMILLRRTGQGFNPISFGATILSIVEEILRDGLAEPSFLPTRRLDKDTEYFLEDCLRAAFGEVTVDNSEFLEICLHGLALDEDETALRIKQLALCRTGFEAWIRKGYRRAVRRYENRDLSAIRTVTFSNITKVVDDFLKTEYAWEGAKVRVKAEVSGRYTAMAELWEPEERRWIDTENF